MKTLQVGHGRTVKLDDADFARVGSAKIGVALHVSPSGDRRWYARVQGQYLHRFVMGAPRGVDVDHKNHDTLDCRRANLRFATTSQNVRNRKGANSNSRSGVRGVSWDTTRGLWTVRVRTPEKYAFIGRFARKSTARLAAIEARKTLFGEFAGAA